MFRELLFLVCAAAFVSTESDFIRTLQEGKFPDWFSSTIKRPLDLDTMDLIRANGYPAEAHNVISGDGYILGLHRIPRGIRNSNGNETGDDKPARRRMPVFVMHGNFQSSADWVLNEDPNNCFGFLLAEAGYDVWLGNLRGNVYSNRHVNKSSLTPGFWNFSFDEMGKYDVPAIIDYILKTTQQEQLHYIAFSLGTTMFYTGMIQNPTYNSKVKFHISIGPSVFFGKWRSLAVLFSPLVAFPQFLQDLTGGFPIPTTGTAKFLSKLLPFICNPKLDWFGICRNVMFFMLGYGADGISHDQVPEILGHIPSPASFKTVVHGMQMMNHKRFAKYDYGPLRNFDFYNQSTAPDYDLSLVTAPVALVRGPNDIFANPDDVDRLAALIPNLVDYFVVPNEQFTHIEFTYGRQAASLAYEHILALLRRFTS